MSTPDAPLTIITEVPQNCALATTSVDIQGIDPGLLQYARVAGLAHVALFGTYLTITSGKDGQHAPGGAHPKGKALDFRSHDLSPEQQLMYGTLLCYLAQRYGVRVFDERSMGTDGHWHVEV